MIFWDCRGWGRRRGWGEEADIRSVFGGSDLFSGCFQILNRGWKYLRDVVEWGGGRGKIKICIREKLLLRPHSIFAKTCFWRNVIL